MPLKQNNQEEIVSFLIECVDKDYELDKDDIEHILKGDFNYIRKQHQLTEFKTIEDVTRYLTEHEQ